MSGRGEDLTKVMGGIARIVREFDEDELDRLYVDELEGLLDASSVVRWEVDGLAERIRAAKINGTPRPGPARPLPRPTPKPPPPPKDPPKPAKDVSISRHCRATLRQMELAAERIRSMRGQAKVNPVYREALVHLATVVEINLDYADADPYSNPARDEIADLETLYAERAVDPGH